jgi:hypothetical protein
MSRQLRDGWLDTVPPYLDLHCKEACWTLRKLLKTENILPHLGMELLFLHRSSHSRFTVLTTEIWGFSSHVQGSRLKAEPRRTASQTALYCCMLCISTVSREELVKVLIICLPGDKHVWELEDVNYNTCINMRWVVLLHVTYIWGNVRPG